MDIDLNTTPLNQTEAWITNNKNELALWKADDNVNWVKNVILRENVLEVNVVNDVRS